MKKHTWIAIVFLAVVLVLASSWGCAKKEEPVEEAAVETEEVTEEPVAEELAEPVYTRDNVGEYEGMQDAHLPVIAYEKSDIGLKVTVTVNHEMNAETPHYIMWIKIKDAEDNLLGEKMFEATDAAAEAVFDLAEIPAAIKAFEKCNVHGIWMDEAQVTFEE